MDNIIWIAVQVHYATALDWFIICSFLYCMASILEFAGVHYFTKVTKVPLAPYQKVVFLNIVKIVSLVRTIYMYSKNI